MIASPIIKNTHNNKDRDIVQNSLDYLINNKILVFKEYVFYLDEKPIQVISDSPHPRFSNNPYFDYGNLIPCARYEYGKFAYGPLRFTSRRSKDKQIDELYAIEGWCKVLKLNTIPILIVFTEKEVKKAINLIKKRYSLVPTKNYQY